MVILCLVFLQVLYSLLSSISVSAFFRNTLRLDLVESYWQTTVYEDWEDSQEALEMQTVCSSCGLKMVEIQTFSLGL